MKEASKINLFLHDVVAEKLKDPLTKEGVNLLQKRDEALKVIERFPEDTWFVVVPAGPGAVGVVKPGVKPGK